MNRRGMAMLAKISAIIALLLGFAVVVFSQTSILDKAVNSVTPADACRYLVGIRAVEESARDSAKALAHFAPRIIQQNCMTTFVEIDADDLEVRNKDLTKDRVTKVFVDKMAEAWRIVHEGQVENVWNNEGGIGGSWGKRECVMLYSISFRGKLPADKIPDLGWIQEYTREENYMQDNLGRSWTYQTYFTTYGTYASGDASPGVPYLISSKDEDDFRLEPDKTYGVAIAAYSEASGWRSNAKWWLETLSADFSVTADHQPMYIFLGEYDTLLEGGCTVKTSRDAA